MPSVTPSAMMCWWWDWYDLPPEYAGYDAPEFLLKTRGYGGYILAPSQDIRSDVPFENLCAMIDTALSLSITESAPVWGFFVRYQFNRKLKNAIHRTVD